MRLTTISIALAALVANVTFAAPANHTARWSDIQDYTQDNCNTSCLGVGGHGPNEADCLVLAQWFWDAGTVAFTVQPGEIKEIQRYKSCVVRFTNPSRQYKVAYPYNRLGSVTDWLRQRCNMAHSADGGVCNFADKTGTGMGPFIGLYNTA